MTAGYRPSAVGRKIYARIGPVGVCTVSTMSSLMITETSPCPRRFLDGDQSLAARKSLFLAAHHLPGLELPGFSCGHALENPVEITPHMLGLYGSKDVKSLSK